MRNLFFLSLLHCRARHLFNVCFFFSFFRCCCCRISFYRPVRIRYMAHKITATNSFRFHQFHRLRLHTYVSFLLAGSGFVAMQCNVWIMMPLVSFILIIIIFVWHRALGDHTRATHYYLHISKWLVIYLIKHNIYFVAAQRRRQRLHTYVWYVRLAQLLHHSKLCRWCTPDFLKMHSFTAGCRACTFFFSNS